MSSESGITQLLDGVREGDRDAAERFAAAVYPHLRRLAGAFLKNEHAADTLQPTALANEVYLRLWAQGLPRCESRGQFFGMAAHRMRQILVDHARSRRSAKRGGGVEAVTLDDGIPQEDAADGLLDLDAALDDLARLDPRKHSVVELRYFGGLTIEETAQALGISVATVARDQRFAEAWLKRELEGKERLGPRSAR